MAQLTLYGFEESPYSEKVKLALKEGKIAHKYCEINLFNKPAFFAEKVTPVGQVPAITYGGPDVAPEEPSELSEKLAESNVILEFLADAYPESKLMPTDPVQRAKVRFFIEAVGSKLVPVIFQWILHQVEGAKLLEAIGSIQDLLPESPHYAVGESYTIADACITPFIHRLHLSIEYDIGKFPVGDGPKFGESLKDPKFAKFNSYVNAVTNRPVSKEVFIAENIKGDWNTVFGRK